MRGSNPIQDIRRPGLHEGKTFNYFCIKHCFMPAQRGRCARQSPSNSSLGVKSTSRLTKLKRTPRTPASCMACNSASPTLRLTVPRRAPCRAGSSASSMARLSAPWHVACTTTLRANPGGRAVQRGWCLDASQGVYLRSGAYGNRARANTWHMPIDAAAGTRKRGLDGPAYQSSQPGVLANAVISVLLHCCRCDRLDAPVAAAGKARVPLGADTPSSARSATQPAALPCPVPNHGVSPTFAHRVRRLWRTSSLDGGVLDDALEEVGGLLLPIDARKVSARRPAPDLRPVGGAGVKLSMTIASRPLIITLRHILVADATRASRWRPWRQSRAWPSTEQFGRPAATSSNGTLMGMAGSTSSPRLRVVPPAPSISAAAVALRGRSRG